MDQTKSKRDRVKVCLMHGAQIEGGFGEDDNGDGYDDGGGVVGDMIFMVDD